MKTTVKELDPAESQVTRGRRKFVARAVKGDVTPDSSPERSVSPESIADEPQAAAPTWKDLLRPNQASVLFAAAVLLLRVTVDTLSLFE